MKKILTSITAVLIISSLFAQKEKTELRLNLRDGSIISGTTNIGNNIVLGTPWGKLEIPLKNISQLSFGIKTEAGQKEKVRMLLTELNNADEKKRKSTYESLTNLSIGCIPLLEDLLFSGEAVPAVYTDYTAEMALSELKGRHNVDNEYLTEDLLTTDNGYRIGGNYELKTVTLKTEYGTLEISRDKIKTMEVFYTGSDGSSYTFVLQASKHISGNNNGGWLRTGINLRAGQKFSITASGEVTLASLSGYKYTPDGKYSGGGSPDAEYEGDYGTSGGNYPIYGNVVFKIGESGNLMKAGAAFSGSAQASGMLYLSIYETVYNSGNSGAYTVRVRLQ